jgi:hypothetical protein
VQLTQLALVDGAGAMCKQILGPLSLGEGDDIADRLGTGHQGHDAVQTEREAAVRGRTVLERIEQEAELSSAVNTFD